MRPYHSSLVAAARRRPPIDARFRGRFSNRRGMALAMALMFTLAIGAIVTSAIILNSNAALMAKSVNRQRDLSYAAEAALQIGKSQLNFDAAALPDSGDRQIITDAPVEEADGSTLPNIRINAWIGPTGSTTGQFGRFASVVAQAVDNHGFGFVRRLELTQESFAKFAYWTDQETCCGGLTIYFNSGDELWGPVYSNDVIHIGSGGAKFHDDVSTAKTISGTGYGTFYKGYTQHAAKITLPSTSILSTLPAYAALAGYNFTSGSASSISRVLTRIEFVATDIMGTGDSLSIEDGFFRVYTANPGNYHWLRADWPGGSTTSNYLNCGDWHAVTPGGPLEFFPVAVHNTTWFKNLMIAGGMSSSQANSEASASVQTILSHAGARCYPGGDPHLVAVARTSALYPSAADRQKGGTDTTFTPIDAYGSWTKYSDTPVAKVAAARPNDADYLFPIYRGFNTNVKGVITFTGNTAVSGTLRGRVTLYDHNGSFVLLDDLRYADDPALGVCADILGLLSDDNIVVADNSINTPQDIKTGSGTLWKSLDDTQDMYVQSVLMALNTSFTVENYSSGPSSALSCQGSSDGRGCLMVTGGIIQENRGPVGLSSGQGYVKRYAYDRCAAVHPPPYFPTTGRFVDNRYMEINPVGFDVTALFKSLSPGS